MINQQSAPNADTAIPAPGPGRESAHQHIKTIREILVGDQIHSLNDRFQNLEKSLEAHYAKLVNQLMAKFEAVQTLSKCEVEELGKSVTEKVERLTGEDTKLAEELKKTQLQIKDLEKKQDEAKAALADQVRKMYEEFSKQMSEFTRIVKQQNEEMGRKVVYRSDLANLLTGLAGSISSQPKEQPKKNG